MSTIILRTTPQEDELLALACKRLNCSEEVAITIALHTLLFDQLLHDDPLKQIPAPCKVCRFMVQPAEPPANIIKFRPPQQRKDA